MALYDIGVRSKLKNKLDLRPVSRNLHTKFEVFNSYSLRDRHDQTHRRTDRQTDMAKLTRVLILIKNIYT